MEMLVALKMPIWAASPASKPGQPHSVVELHTQQQIGQATLVAPISGRIISEDLKRDIGAPVEKGKILFEIASIDALRAELYVPEELIADVREGQQGVLASVGRPDKHISESALSWSELIPFQMWWMIVTYLKYVQSC